MTVTTEDGGRQNLFAKEPKMYAQEITVTHNEFAETLNDRMSTLGVIDAIAPYACTGQLVPGLW